VKILKAYSYQDGPGIARRSQSSGSRSLFSLPDSEKNNEKNHEIIYFCLTSSDFKRKALKKSYGLKN